MKKIGILTFHKSINFGAYLQCYSLSTRLKQDYPDCNIEVIDYVPKRVQDSGNMSLFKFVFGTKGARTDLRTILIRIVSLLRNPILLKEYKIRAQAFMKDWGKLPLSENQYSIDNIEKVLDAIAEEYDTVIVGSDGVWEYISNPFPNVYYLGTAKIKNRLSFAASSDRMYFPHITEDQANYIRNSLSGFHYIGVRDVATENFLHSIEPSLKLSHNCDPTIFLNIEALPSDLDRIKSKLRGAGIDLSKSIIGIMGDDDIGNFVRGMFGDKYQIVAVYSKLKVADYYLDDLTPLEWARVFSLFAVTFTRYFHGTILSLKNGTPPITLDPWKMEDENHITKINDLYIRLDLLNHYFKKKRRYTNEEIDEIKARAEEFIAHPDKVEIAAAVEKEALNYFNLKEALDELMCEEI